MPTTHGTAVDVQGEAAFLGVVSTQLAELGILSCDACLFVSGYF